MISKDGEEMVAVVNTPRGLHKMPIKLYFMCISMYMTNVHAMWYKLHVTRGNSNSLYVGIKCEVPLTVFVGIKCKVPLTVYMYV